MQLLQYLKWLIIGLFLSSSVALACQENGSKLKQCDIAHKKICEKSDVNTDKSHCNQKKKHGCHSKKCMFLNNLRYTLKHLKISESDWKDVKVAMRSYKDDIRKIQMVTPIKSIQGGKFNRKLFLDSHPMHKKLAAKADLIETIFLILDEKQKSKFAMLMGASQFHNSLHPRQNDNCHSCHKNKANLCAKPLKQ